MPSQNPQPPATPSPFEIVTPSKSSKGGKKGMIVAILVVIFLLLSVVAGVLLVRNNQNVQEKAQTGSCPGIQVCPAPGGTELRNCTPPEIGNQPAVSTCNSDHVGRIEPCGSRTYCCNGSTWSTNMTACVVATPTATAVATPSPTATTVATSSPAATATATATAVATRSPTVTPVPTLATGTTIPVAQTTPLPIPATGTGWPTYLGAGVGILVILASILIAL